MTEETAPETSNLYMELKNEMTSQMDALRQSFDAYKEEKETELAQLKEDNKQLQRALIKETFSPAEQPKQEPTEEELYANKVQALAARSKELMKQVI